MAKEICISSTPHETRLAILEDDQLAEIYYERENEYTLAGSIYNGRVTRVLPGMQSAFVDVGLERDAFLYVTDFMELEDAEETDELEKAAVSGASQPPREVRGGRNGQKPDQKPELKQEARPAPEKSRRLTVEALPEAETSALPASVAEVADGSEQDSSEAGAKRWRGRRRRRGGRGGAGAHEGQPQTGESSAISVEPIPETGTGSGQEVAPQIQAGAAAAPAPRADRAPAEPFVMPGESLAKHGGTPVGDAPKAEMASAPPRTASSFKPATLIDTPIQWGGSGLLPGESLSRHRKNAPADEAPAQPQSIVAEEPLAANAAPDAIPDAVEEQEFVEETTNAQPLASEDEPIEAISEDELVSKWTKASLAEAAPLEEDEFEETSESVSEPLQAQAEVEAAEPEPDASAEHNLDPLPPNGFRFFGLGKKKTDEKARPASTYAPGKGLIEEEVIDEEEFVAPRHPRHAKAAAHDTDDFEEETLPNQLRTGDLGEMLQEAHLDHRIQLNFDGNEDEDEEEPAVAEGSAPQRHDRNARGRRGRGGPATSGAPAPKGRGMSRRSMQTSDLPIISDLLKSGQEILVQIAKEPIAKKGARITSHIALPGRFLVFMPTVSHIGVSRKIESDTERQRLKRILVHERGEASGGFIVRTAAENASEEELRTDLRFLLNLWAEIKHRSDESKSPALIYHDLGLIERILRDQVSSNFSSIWVDSQENYERIVRFLNRFSPSLVRRVKLYTKETPLFEHFGIQDEIAKALNSKVWLKSGGSIVINQTEALVAIDINTGKYVGKSARLEDTIVKTNLDAVPEIVRQIRLRDLGGIIVIDFIDMDDRKNRFKVMAALEEALKSDRAPTKVLQFNDFGLVAITRKRVKQSLERTLSVPCPTCMATGMVKSPTTVCNEIYTELRKMKKHFENPDVLLRVNPETVKTLKSNNGSWLTEYEELIGKNILIKSDATLHPEQFDIQG
jgi:ribonuclease G